MRTLHVQQRCVPPPFDIHRSIDVGVVGMATRDASEARLALAAPCINNTARGAGLAREPSRDSHDLTAPFLHLVGQDRCELVPTCVQDHAVETSFLAHVPTGLGDGAARRGSHLTCLQIFENSHAAASRYVESGPVVEVSPNASLSGLEPGDTSLCSLPTLRPSLATGHDPLCFPLGRFDQPKTPRQCQHFAGREGERCHYTPIDADNPRTRRGRLAFNLAREGDVPAGGIKADGRILQSTPHRSSVSKLYPAYFRQANGGPLRVQASCFDLTAWKAEGVIDASLSWARIACPSREEALERPVQVAKCLLLAGNVYGSDPIEFASQPSKVCGLQDIANAVLSAPSRSLLKCEIVDKTAHARELLEQVFLLGQRNQLKAVSADGDHAGYFSGGSILAPAQSAPSRALPPSTATTGA